MFGCFFKDKPHAAMNVDADGGRLPVDSPIIGHTLRTVSSNSSISSAASGASLNRQPRTRGRSRTVTGNSAIKPNTTNVVNHDQMPISTGPVAADTSRAEESNAEEPIRMTKAAKQGSQLAAIKTKQPPSAFSRVPLSQIDAIEGVGVNVRDSMITQESEQTNISTVYPLSTLSSATASPRSPTFSERSVQVDDFKSFEEDDVSYRLRLLVNNNYFLPPAHSKPLPAQLIPATNPNAVKKLPAPTFLDLFRIGRSKSKPPTPTSESGNGGQALTPALRTTSDATAVSGFPMQMQIAVSSSSSSAPPRTSNLARPPDRSGRVVVVREKMADLASAAKQAEFEVKIRSLQRDTRREQAVNLPSMDDVIDPTDAVDLPLPSSAYPFAVQTSALHGLGVHESVGAAALASRLPPPRDRSSAVSSFGPDDDEEDWKKALLKAAVGHSFDNLTVAAEGALARSPRSPRSPSSSMMSSLPPGSPAPSPVPITSAPVPAARINKKIISNPIQLDTSLSKSPSVHSASHIQTHAFTNHSRPRGWSSPASPTSPSAPSPIPIRTETPLDLMPLMPPPRSPKSPRSPRSVKREIINPVYSISQTDLTETAGPAAASVSQSWNGGNTNHVYTMTPPPGYWRSGGLGMTPRDSSESSQSSFRPRDSSDRETTNSNTSRSRRTTGSGVGDPETPDSISMYSTMTGVFPDEENENLPRASSSRSTITSTAQSPTTSAFQDALSRNPPELRIDGDGHAHQQPTDPPPVPSLAGPTDGTSAPSASVSSPFQPPEPIERSDPATPSPRPPSASSLPIPSTSLTPATPVSAPSRTTSLHYRDLRNRHFSALMQNNTLPTYASYLSHPPSAYNTNMPPPPTLAHRSASDHGHGTFTPPPPALRKRPPTAPAAPILTPRIELIEISAPEPTTPPFPSFASLPSFPSLPTIRSPSSSSSARSVHSARSAPPSPPSPLSPSSPSSQTPSSLPSQSQPSLIERRHHGVGNPLRGSLHIPTSIIPPAIHSAPPPTTPPFSSSFPLFAGPPSAGPSSMMMMTPPSSSMSFFDTIQTQPNAMDYLDESSDESSDDDDEDEDEDECEYDNGGDENRAGNENNEKDDDEGEDFRTAEGGTTAGSGRERGASVTNSILSSLSAYSTPSAQPTARRPSTSRSNISSHSNLSNHSNRSNFSIRTPLMRLGNHSTPYVSHTSLHTSDTGIDRRLPIGNIAESKSPREFFTKKMRDDEQVLESKWDLWKYTRVGQGEGVRADVVTGSGVGTGTGTDIVDTGAEIAGEVEVAAGPSSRSYSYSYSSHPYARAYGPHHSRNYSRDAPSSFAGISGSTGTAVGGNRIRATSSSSDRGYGYGYGSQTQTQQAQTQAQQKMESKKLDGMLKMHMEAEKDQMKRMAERMKQTQVQDKASGSRGAIKSKR